MWKEGIHWIKLPGSCTTKKAFWRLQYRTGQPYWSKKKSTLKGIFFWVKNCPHIKIRKLFLTSYARKGIWELEKSIFEWKFSSIFSDHPNKAKSKRKKSEKTSAIKWNSWGQKATLVIVGPKKPPQFFLKNLEAKISSEKKSTGPT